MALVISSAACGANGDLRQTGPDLSPTQATVALPRLSNLDVHFDALHSGVLIEDRGCLFLESADGRMLLLWPDGFTAEITGQQITVINQSGDVAATKGSHVTISGGEVSPRSVPALTEPNAAGMCNASHYWAVQDIESSEGNREV